MYRGYRIVFWGLFFSTFTINLWLLPILPDFVAALILCYGLSLLYKEQPHPFFERAMYCAGVEVAWNVLFWFWPTENHYMNLVAVGIGFTLDLLLYYWLLSGSAEVLAQQGFGDDAEDYERKTRWAMIWFSLVAIAALLAVTFNLSSGATSAGVVGLIVTVWLLAAIHRLKKIDWEGEPLPDDAEDDRSEEPELDLPALAPEEEEQQV